MRTPMKPCRLSPVKSGGAGNRASPGSSNMAIPAIVPQTAQPSGSVPLRISPREMMVQVWEGLLPEITPPLTVWHISGSTMLARKFQEKL